MTSRSEEQRSAKRQERGRRRIESILDVAEQVIAEVGYESATTNLIAARAAISPGSLYKYFANKQSIAEALSARYVSDLAETNDGLVGPELVDLPIEALVDRVVDPILAFNLAHPAAKALLGGADVSPELAEATASLHQVLCDRVEHLLGEIAPQLGGRERHLAATVSFQVFAGVLPTVVAAGRRDRPAVVRQLKAVLVGYWGPLAAGGPSGSTIRT